MDIQLVFMRLDQQVPRLWLNLHDSSRSESQNLFEEDLLTAWNKLKHAAHDLVPDLGWQMWQTSSLLHESVQIGPGKLASLLPLSDVHFSSCELTACLLQAKAPSTCRLERKQAARAIALQQ